MSDMIIKAVNIVPMSVNKAWQGRKWATPGYKKYQEDLGKLLGTIHTIAGPVKIGLVFTLPRKIFSRTDVDNLIKPVLDVCVKRGFIEDDRKVIELTARKQVGDSKVEILIEPINV